MALIEFENYPSTDTAINATNLNNNFNELLNQVTVTKLWEDNTTTTWGEGYLNINVSNYDFLLIVTSKQTSFVPATFYTSLTWCGWKESVNTDVVTVRDAVRSGNDIHFGKCYYRGIRGNTSFGEAPEIDVPRAVYGFKFKTFSN